MLTRTIDDITADINATRTAISEIMRLDGEAYRYRTPELEPLRRKLNWLNDELDAEGRKHLYSSFTATRTDELPLPAQNRARLTLGRSDLNAAFRRYLQTGMVDESRSGLNSSSGGALVPQTFAADWIAALKYFGPVLAKVSVSNSWPLKKVISDDTANGMKLVAEQADSSTTPNTEADAILTADIVSVDNLVTRTRASFQTWEDSGFDLGEFLRGNIALQASRSIEQAIWNAKDTAGVALPNSPTSGLLGFAGTAAGSPTVTVAAHGAVAFADLTALRASVNPAYRLSGSYHASQAVFDALDAQTDSTGQKLYHQNADGSLDIGGNPLYSSPALTNDLTAASGSKLVIFGDLSRAYQVAMSETPGIRVLLENPGSFDNLKRTLLAFLRFGAATLLPQACAALVQK